MPTLIVASLSGHLGRPGLSCQACKYSKDNPKVAHPYALQRLIGFSAAFPLVALAPHYVFYGAPPSSTAKDGQLPLQAG